jgi:hypothetical protein
VPFGTTFIWLDHHSKYIFSLLTRILYRRRSGHTWYNKDIERVGQWPVKRSHRWNITVDDRYSHHHQFGHLSIMSMLIIEKKILFSAINSKMFYITNRLMVQGIWSSTWNHVNQGTKILQIFLLASKNIFVLKLLKLFQECWKTKLYHEINGSHEISRIRSWNRLFSTLLTGTGTGSADPVRISDSTWNRRTLSLIHF